MLTERASGAQYLTKPRALCLISREFVEGGQNGDAVHASAAIRGRGGSQRVHRGRTDGRAARAELHAAGTGRHRAGDVHQGRRADPSEVMSELPSAGLGGADVAADLRGCASVGAVDQGQGARPRDAALARRPEHRHHQVQERSVADRRRDRHHRAVGRRRCADGQPGRHAAAAHVRRHRQVVDWQAGRDCRHGEAVHPRADTARTTSSTCSSTRASPRTCTSRRSKASRSTRRASTSCTTSRRTSWRIRWTIQPACSSTNTRSERTPTSSRRTRAG